MRMMEPYVLIRKVDSPWYDETLLHRYYNKIVYADRLVKNR